MSTEISRLHDRLFRLFWLEHDDDDEKGRREGHRRLETLK